VGGGAVYLDSTQLFYHFIWQNDSTHIPKSISGIFQTLLKPVVQTYKDFGVDAVYKPVNDIMVNNRKISGNGAGMFDSASVLVGNFILDFPRQEMARILRVPDEKFRDKVFKSLQAGISSFKDELGYIPEREEIVNTFRKNLEEILGITFVTSNLSFQIQKKMDELKTLYLTDEWRYQMDHRGEELYEAVKIHSSLNIAQGIHKSEGGLIRVMCEFQQSKIIDIMFSGDFWIAGAELSELENHLKGFDIREEDLITKIEEYLDKPEVETSGTTAFDFGQAIMNAFKTLKA
jgi:lipoate-protein ligase A